MKKGKTIMAHNTEIGEDVGEAIFINMFTIPQGKQPEELITMLRNITRDVMQPQKGFRSSKLHISIDRERVVVYSEWDSEDDFRNVFRLPEAREQLERIIREFPRDPRFYTIVDVFGVESTPAHHQPIELLIIQPTVTHEVHRDMREEGMDDAASPLDLPVLTGQSLASS